MRCRPHSSARRFSAAILAYTCLIACTADGWRQYHSDITNTGFFPVHTGEATKVKWRTPVGEVYNSSPVIGPRGQIIVATVDGRVMALRPTDGGILWSRDLNLSPNLELPELKIRSTPAVQDNGDVWVVAHMTYGPTGKRHSVLIRLDNATGYPGTPELLSSASPDPMKPDYYKWNDARGWTLSSPKIMRGGYASYIFVHARDEEYSKHSLCVLRPLGGGSGAITDAVLPLPCATPNNAPPLSDSVPFWTDPSPAVVPIAKYNDRLGLLNPVLTDHDGDPYRPYDWIIVVANNQCAIGAYMWDPQAPSKSARAFKQLWSHDSSADVLYTTPFVTPTDEVIVGTSDGKVQSYDIVTGAPFWTPPTQLQGQIWEPPASFAGTGIFTYIATTTRLYKLFSNGDIDTSVPLPEKVRATPATSLDRLYLNSSAGLHTFGLDLTPTFVAPEGASNNMFTSPTIGPDGTIYVITANGDLVAYESGVPE
ncbi:MAG: PQQ-binding-like beta-propeller repeat protein [Planctomycetota bacterium]